MISVPLTPPGQAKAGDYFMDDVGQVREVVAVWSASDVASSSDLWRRSISGFAVTMAEDAHSRERRSYQRYRARLAKKAA